MVRPCQASRGLAEPCQAECRGDELLRILAFHELGGIISPQGPWGRVIQGTGGALALHSARPHRVWAGQDWFREVKGEVLGWPWEFLSHFRDFFSVERI